MFINFKYLIFIFIFLTFSISCVKREIEDIDYSSFGYINPILYPKWYLYLDSLNIKNLDQNSLYYSINDNSSIDLDYLHNNDKKIRLFWDGNVTTNYSKGLKSSVFALQLNTKIPKDLSIYKYNRFKCDISGYISEDVKLIIKINDVIFEPIISNLPETFKFETEVSDLTNVTSLCVFSLESKNLDFLKTGGADIFLDNICFTRDK